MRIGVVCLWLVLGVVSTGFALPVTFDFSIPDSDFVYQAGDFTLSVEGFSDAEEFKFTQTDDGLGVFSGTSDDPQFENSGPDEFIEFWFLRVVILQKIVFGLVDDDDDFVFSVDGSLVSDPIRIWSDPTIPLIEKFYMYDFGLNGSLFRFGVSDSQDNIRIKSITVDTPIPTPEPATWLLLGTGLIGLVFWRKKSAG